MLPRAERDPALTRILVPSALFLLGVAVRALPWPTVFGQHGVYFTGPDAYYHARRIGYAVANFPGFLERDLYVAFPSGAEAIWTPVFDWLLALLVRATLGGGSPQALESLLVWVPPLLGGATVVAAYLLAARHLSRPVAVCAGLILCLLPAHFWFSQLGHVDHHVAVALVTTLLLYVAMNALEEEARLRSAAALGAALGGVLLVWPGCLLHVGLVEAALLARVLGCVRRESAVGLARRFALANGVACLVVLPLSAGNEWEQWGALSPVVLSNFQPLGFAAGAAAFALLSVLWQQPATSGSRAARALQALACGAALAGPAFWLLPGLSEGVADAWEWLARAEPFQAVVAESRPLFKKGSGDAVFFFSRLVFATPLMIAALAVRAMHGAPRPAMWLLVWWSSALGAATLAQLRFANSFSIAYALLLGFSLVELFRLARRRLADRPAFAAAAASLSLAVLVYAVAPVGRDYAAYVDDAGRALRGAPLRGRHGERSQRILANVARWLGSHSPKTSGYLDDSQRPEYGVLAPWGAGHMLRYIARRPMVQDNFGDDVGPLNFALAERYFAADSEAQAVAILEELGVRYVVVRGGGSGHGRGYDSRSMFARLQFLRGVSGSFDEGAGPPVRVPALVRHRLIYDSDIGRRPDAAPPHYKIYEVVSGARIEGRAAAGAEVEAQLPLWAGRAEPFLFMTRTRADSAGRYALTLPYANRPADSAVSPGRHYRLRSGAAQADLVLSDAEIRSGARIAGPDLSSD
jgi:dolichyl-diphosphooligosaccharide--protein glycosyltransferase